MTDDAVIVLGDERDRERARTAKRIDQLVLIAIGKGHRPKGVASEFANRVSKSGEHRAQGQRHVAITGGPSRLGAGQLPSGALWDVTYPASGVPARVAVNDARPGQDRR